MSGNTDRQRIFDQQAHAFGHLVQGDLPLAVAACPMCFGLFGSGELHGCSEHVPSATIEHAPPRQRTRLSSNGRAACLTHRQCNGDQGYEAQAGRHQKEVARLRTGSPGKVWGRIDGVDGFVDVVRRPEGGLVPHAPLLPTQKVEVSMLLPEPAQLTELKAAYLIAFSVLGYSWASSSLLDPIRQAITSGDASALGVIPLFINHDPQPDAANVVVAEQCSESVAVIGDDPRFGVLLPNTSPVNPSSVRLSIGGRMYSWLPDQWWRLKESQAFRWDCSARSPMWRLEVA